MNRAQFLNRTKATMGLDQVMRLFAMAALLGLLGFSTTARAEDGTDYMTQAAANVMAAAKAVSNVSDYGYVSNTCFLGAYLERQKTVTLETTLNAGEEYLFLGGGDNDVNDLRVEVVQKYGSGVASSGDQHDAHPYVFLKPDHTGQYLLEVTLRQGDASASFVSLAILKQGGLDVPLSSLTSATVKLMASCQAIQQLAPDHKIGFESAPDQWAVYGAILHTGEGSNIQHLTPGAGKEVVLAAGDDDAGTVAIAVNSENLGSPIINQDKDVQGLPLMGIQTDAGTMYSLRTDMVSSENDRNSLVLTGVLSVR